MSSGSLKGGTIVRAHGVTANGKTVKAFDVPRTNTRGDVVFTATLELDLNTHHILQAIVLAS
jgi:hypothetical protein